MTILCYLLTGPTERGKRLAAGLFRRGKGGDGKGGAKLHCSHKSRQPVLKPVDQQRNGQQGQVANCVITYI